MIDCSQYSSEQKKEGQWERTSIEDEWSDRMTKRRLNELIMREIEWIQKEKAHERNNNMWWTTYLVRIVIWLL